MINTPIKDDNKVFYQKKIKRCEEKPQRLESNPCFFENTFDTC